MPARSLGLLAVLVASLRAAAQSLAPTAVEAPRLDGWLTGVSLGLPGYGSATDPTFFTFGFNVSRLRPGHLGPDLSIGTLPMWLAEGAVPFGVRAGFALPVEAAPHFLVLPSAGLTVIGLLSPDGGGAIRGYNVGLATVAYSGTVGLRTGVTLHSFPDARGAAWLLEVGIVSVPLRRY
jgi:hypothetical protein